MKPILTLALLCFSLITHAQSTWTGASSSNWNIPGNWNPTGVPNASTDVTIPAGTPNSPSFFSAPTTIASLNVNAGATLTNSSIINITGGLTNAGTISGGTMNVGGSISNTSSIINNVSLNLNGSTAQSISGTGTIGNMNMNNSNGATITSGSLSLTGTLNLTAGALTTNGLLTLKSSASSTARIGSIGSGSINGTFTQERYIPAKGSRTYSLVASPFTQLISNAWQQQVHITGAGTGGSVCPSLSSNSNGFDATVTNTPSMYVYNGANAVGSRWASIANTNATSLAAGTGYRMNIRGPRTAGCSLLDGTTNSVAAVTLSSTGTLSNANKNMGSFTTTVLNNGNTTLANDNYLLVGNPYPSQISFSALQLDNDGSNGINNGYAIFAPGNTVGNYAYWDGLNSTWSGSTTGLSDATGDIIANGQAFFVQGKIAGADITLNWDENTKSGGTNNGNFRAPINPNRLRIGLQLADGNRVDETMLFFKAGASNNQLNSGDRVSMSNGNQYLKTVKANSQLVFNTHNLSFVSDTVQLSLGSNNSGQFSLSFYDFEEFIQHNNTKIFLLDKHTGTVQLMNDNKDYTFTVDTQVPTTFGSGRFAVVFVKAAPVAISLPADIKAYPNPAMYKLTIELASNVAQSVRLLDIYGRTVLQTKAYGTTSLNTSKLAKGTYLLETMNDKGEKSTQKIIKQ